MTAQDRGARKNASLKQAEAFAEWLRDVAGRRGYTLAGPGRRAGGLTQLAQEAGLPQSVVSRVLSGDTRPSAETALKLARPLLVSPAEALERAGHGTLAAYLREMSSALGVAPASQVLERIESADLDETTKRRLATSYQREVAQLVARFDEMIETALHARREGSPGE
jgi:transcriptional regulator with XRE-family HTH domain